MTTRNQSQAMENLIEQVQNLIQENATLAEHINMNETTLETENRYLLACITTLKAQNNARGNPFTNSNTTETATVVKTKLKESDAFNGHSDIRF